MDRFHPSPPPVISPDFKPLEFGKFKDDDRTVEGSVSLSVVLRESGMERIRLFEHFERAIEGMEEFGLQQVSRGARAVGATKALLKQI